LQKAKLTDGYFSPRYLLSFMLSFSIFTVLCLLSFSLSIILMREMDDYIDLAMNIFNDSSNVRRNETICCLIGFGIGVGCCILYRLISNILTPSSTINTNNTNSSLISQHEAKTSITSNVTDTKRERLIKAKHKHDDYIRNNNNSDEMTWSEMSSSLSTVNLHQDSYHSNSLTADSGVDCTEIPIRNHQRYNDSMDYDEENETLLRKYDSDTAINHGVLLRDTQSATESHVMSYVSTEKGLERALEQTSRFYTDLEHIAIELGTLTKRYSQSQTSLTKIYHRPIDALDWDWHDDIHSPIIQSPKATHRKQYYSLSLNRSNNKNKIRRRLNTNMNQTEYNESDNDNRSFDCTTSPLRRRHSSVYFNSTDNSSDEENLANETLHTTS